MKCECGFEFAGPGEFRNCEVKICENGDQVTICPNCGTAYTSN